MSEEEISTVAIEVATLALIRASVLPLKQKLDSLMETHYTQNEYRFTDLDLNILFELSISCRVLDEYLGNLIEEANSHALKKIEMQKDEILLVSTMVNSVTSAGAFSIGNTNLLEH